MTDRINALTIILDRDIREDDVEPLMTAIAMMRGVLAVKSHVALHTDSIAEERAKRELRAKLWEVLK